MLPEMTVHPVMAVLLIGNETLHGSPVNVPISKLPFWNVAADAEAALTSANRAGRIRFILVLPWILRSNDTSVFVPRSESRTVLSCACVTGALGASIFFRRGADDVSRKIDINQGKAMQLRAGAAEEGWL